MSLGPPHLLYPRFVLSSVMETDGSQVRDSTLQFAERPLGPTPPTERFHLPQFTSFRPGQPKM